PSWTRRAGSARAATPGSSSRRSCPASRTWTAPWSSRRCCAPRRGTPRRRRCRSAARPEASPGARPPRPREARPPRPRARAARPGRPAAAGPGGGAVGAAPGPGGASAEAVEAHLRRIAESAEEGMRGLKVFLRAARVAAVEEGRVVIELPPGPGLDRLTSDRGVRARLAERLAEPIGRPVELEVRPAGAPSPADRLTPERVKDEQLARLAREEPVLGKAVQEWELELRD